MNVAELLRQSYSQSPVGAAVREWCSPWKYIPTMRVQIARPADLKTRAFQQLEQMRAILERRLASVGPTVTPNKSIRVGLRLSTEQLQAKDGNPARIEELFTQYRHIRRTLIDLVPNGPKHSGLNPFQYALYRDLALHQASLMEVLAQHISVDGKAGSICFGSLVAHALDLRRVEHMVSLGVPVDEVYDAPDYITGDFTEAQRAAREALSNNSHARAARLTYNALQEAC